MARAPALGFSLLLMGVACEARALVVSDDGLQHTIAGVLPANAIEVRDGPDGQPTILRYEADMFIAPSSPDLITMTVTGSSVIDAVSGTYPGLVLGRESSRVNSLGATILEILVRDDATVRAHGGRANLAVQDAASAEVFGGSFGEVRSWGGGSVTFHDGMVDSTIHAFGGSVRILGGRFGPYDMVVAAEIGTVEIYGGAFDVDTILRVGADAAIEIFGEGFNFPFGDLPPSHGSRLTGTLADGSPFSVEYEDSLPPELHGRITLLPVPEPASASLIMLGTVALAVLQRRARWSGRR